MWLAGRRAHQPQQGEQGCVCEGVHVPEGAWGLLFGWMARGRDLLGQKLTSGLPGDGRGQALLQPQGRHEGLLREGGACLRVLLGAGFGGVQKDEGCCLNLHAHPSTRPCSSHPHSSPIPPHPYPPRTHQYPPIPPHQYPPIPTHTATSMHESTHQCMQRSEHART